MPRDVFISHSAQDKKVSETICAALEQSGIHCWIAPRDVRPGKSFPGEITRAIQQHHFALLNRARDFARKRFAGPDVAGRDPAMNAALLERSTNRLRNFLVLRRMGNENVAWHGQSVPVLLIPSRTSNGIDVRDDHGARRVTCSGKL